MEDYHSTIMHFLGPIDNTKIVDALYEEYKWNDGECFECNIVQYTDGNIRGVARINDVDTKWDIIIKHNADLRRALDRLRRKIEN